MKVFLGERMWGRKSKNGQNNFFFPTACRAKSPPHSGCAQLWMTAVKGNISFKDRKQMWGGVGLG